MTERNWPESIRRIASGEIFCEHCGDIHEACASLIRDAARYRALRHEGEFFGLYIVIGVEDAAVGTLTYSGESLDEAVDEMIREMGEPKQ